MRTQADENQGHRFENICELVHLVKEQLENSEEEMQKEKTQEMKLCCIRIEKSKLRLL